MKAHARRFTLLDAMVLIAATTVGVEGLRLIWDGTTLAMLCRVQKTWSARDVAVRVPHAVQVAGPIVAAWSLGLLGLRLCPPRPSWRRLGTQPGAVACAAAVLAMVVGTVEAEISFAISRATSTQIIGPVQFRPWMTLANLTIEYHNGIGLAVAGAWSAIILGRRWRPEPSWLDRAGRAVGVYWLLMIPWYRLLEALMLFHVVP